MIGGKTRKMPLHDAASCQESSGQEKSAAQDARRLQN
jgi:hypothetical protein